MKPSTYSIFGYIFLVLGIILTVFTGLAGAIQWSLLFMGFILFILCSFCDQVLVILTKIKSNNQKAAKSLDTNPDSNED